jgi:hypothetical protein
MEYFFPRVYVKTSEPIFKVSDRIAFFIDLLKRVVRLQ